LTLDIAPNYSSTRSPASGKSSAPQRTASRDVYAALDLGSNNCRLLVAKPAPSGFRVIDAFSRIVRLGEGVAENGRLSDAAMARTLAALEVCAAKLRRRGVTRFRGVATEACRLADNCDEFLARARAQAGLELEIISGGEEARLALDSCTPLLAAAASHARLFDIGGCSTELIWVRLAGDRPPEVADWTSLACGVVSLAERHGGDSVASGAYGAIVAEAGALVAPFVAALKIGDLLAAGTVQLLGTSGTITTIAGLHLGLARYDRAQVDGFRLTRADIRRQVDRLLAMDLAGRAAEPCIGAGRGDVVIAGCAILEAILQACPVHSVDVADRGLREGMLLGMMRDDDLAV
jgi:exopolyphosphatase/guanosine-5'-triphosphate,3'-diphosphate pyrophosphatase